ncbi:dihydrofolate reductase [Corynebacterium heidelbergense]|uniref:dihydrofolate reductase n=1 Tax=Corynebacterium heidelbergense TaxID=2055947 RepID=A0A364V442_9CORY|nr:dihydrofolate reductase [Corynebacterium heidelbergense]RAV31391.1 dihydrofolate reductase [Corynebacterium heidelbergense]
MSSIDRPTDYRDGEYPELSKEQLKTLGIPGEVEIAMIWAQTTAGVIGDGTDMPWYLPEDLEHFKRSTIGYPVVMGRTSWEALGEKFQPLPGRDNFVITRREGYEAPGAGVFSSIPDAINAASQSAIRAQNEDGPAKGKQPVVWILGGGQVYAQCMPIADRIVVTEVDMEAPESFGVYAPQISNAMFDCAAGPWRTSKRT